MKKIEDYGLRIVKDYPKQGVNFIDINGLLADGEKYKKVINAFARGANKVKQADSAIITPEARGFLFASSVAHKTGLPLVVIRKKGKIPSHPYRFQIQNEYDSYEMEVDSDILKKFDNYIYIDDILATGQTLADVSKALKKKNKKICFALHLTAVEGLNGMRQENSVLQSIPHKEII
ncbi:MAG: adenine phosphoribosyltransferase [Alphaproteobacteria bacterium]|nr:adenine phosphoribosyltransferase [Alphaproteobacteria bacterium]